MRNETTIDQIAGLGDLSRLQFSDLAIHFHTGRAVSNGAGRDKQWVYRSGIMCDAGDVEADVWIEAATNLVKARLGSEYLDKVVSFSRRRELPLSHSSEREMLIYALDLCLSQRWNNKEWVLQEDFQKIVGALDT